MLLQLTRLDERRYETVVTRSDGVRYHVKGVGHMSAIPHDLAHFAVERGLRIHQGFWGSVADGAVFGSLTHLSGRRMPRAAERSKQVLRDNKNQLTATEILVGLFNQAVEEGLEANSPELQARLRRYIWTPQGEEPRQFSSEEIAEVCAGLKEMLELWQNLQIGETLELVWPEPDRQVRRRKR